MKIKQKLSAIALSATMILSSLSIAFADGSKVVTIGADLNAQQKQMMLDYFGVSENEAMIINVTNAEERKYLQGVATDAQLGRRTISCAYVEPTSGKDGINVKTANLTWVTSSMIASTLTTAGLTSANVIAAAPYAVSGTGALTGVIKAFEDASGEKLDETKKELANEELVTTGDLGDEIGQDKAAGVVNDVKNEVIKEGTSDTTQIADIINNVTNNYNVTLTPEQIRALTSLMEKIGAQNYNYNDIKVTLENVKFNINENLSAIGENVDTVGLFEKIKHWFANLGGGADTGILEQTDESALGSDAVVNATQDKVEEAANAALDKAGDLASQAADKAGEAASQAADKAKEAYDKAEEQGLFDKIRAWFENVLSGFGN
ncbi:DUF1002 domain-containing protein [Peptacetobacter sp.]|uniref:DUF1002 domain-containing protein n=1 Tax=unclassified Peptacetobacter TaxID=2991974 RepID=UPI0026372197|nr:DUF1002 domain-containing protein [Peptacetobacter sp.]MEE0451422.1 DUF1002 domain-containing protein [Peptacetobacter sp.]